MTAKGYSLAVMPTGEAYTTLSTLIKRLAREYNAPVFEPHVTVLGEITQPEAAILKRVEQLAQSHSSLQLQMPALPEYMPHLSLLYGPFPLAVKETIRVKIGKAQAAQFTVKRLHVVKTEGEARSWYRFKEIPLF